MTDRFPGTFNLGKVGKKKSLFTNILLIALAALVTWGIYSHFHKNATNGHIVTGLKLTNAQKISESSKAAQSSLKTQDYKGAADSYYAAATNAFVAKNYNQAKDILEECIKKVPDASVPWYVYDSLALVAKQLKDITLERNSLQTAIDKAGTTPNVPQATITNLQKRLQGI